jgi:hyperosmotically inducible periplasmic protein
VAYVALHNELETTVNTHSFTLLAAIPLALALGACTREDMSKANSEVSAKTDKAVVAMNNATSNAAADVRVKSAEASKDLDDAAITASIKTDILKDPDLSVLKIDVDTKDGVVTLNGMADTDAGKARVVVVASNVKGVKEVRNFLTVKHA